MTLQLAVSNPAFFAHGGTAAAARGEGFSCECANCNREIAAPLELKGQLIWCLYCGMDGGFVPMVDHPWHHHKWSFGVSLEECILDKSALADGTYDAMAKARARELGHVLDLY